MKDVHDFITAVKSEANRVESDLEKLAKRYDEEGLSGTAEELRGLMNSMEFIDGQLSELGKRFKGTPETITITKETYEKNKKNWIRAGMNVIKNGGQI